MNLLLYFMYLTRNCTVYANKGYVLFYMFCLLNLFNEMRKRDKMRGLPRILSLFRNEFNKFNNTRARMLDSIHHMTLRLLWNLISVVKKRYNFVIMYATLLWTS